MNNYCKILAIVSSLSLIISSNLYAQEIVKSNVISSGSITHETTGPIINLKNKIPTITSSNFNLNVVDPALGTNKSCYPGYNMSSHHTYKQAHDGSMIGTYYTSGYAITKSYTGLQYAFGGACVIHWLPSDYISVDLTVKGNGYGPGNRTILLRASKYDINSTYVAVSKVVDSGFVSPNKSVCGAVSKHTARRNGIQRKFTGRSGIC